MAEGKKRRRRCTPVIVRTPKTAPLSEEDYELAVARMAAQWWDANGRETTDNEIGAANGEYRIRLADSVEIGMPATDGFYSGFEPDPTLPKRLAALTGAGAAGGR